MHYSDQTNSRSVFNDILEGKIPGVILLTSERFFAILTNKIAATGHTLLIPKRCGIQYHEFTNEELAEFSKLKQVLTKTLLSTYDSPEKFLKIGELVSGFEIKNHYHFHLIPAISGDQISLQNVVPMGLDERIIEGNKIRDALREIVLSYSHEMKIAIPDNQ